MRSVDEIATIIVNCAFHIHRELGPGLLESVYEAVLAHALIEERLEVVRQQPIPITFREGVKRVANGLESLGAFASLRENP